MTNLDTFFEQFENWVIQDIRIVLELQDRQGNLITPDRTLSVRRRPLVAGVMLICCAIDTLAAFRYGREKEKVGQHFTNFVREYFNYNNEFDRTYRSKKVYYGLRNALLHGYSLGKVLALSHTNPARHLTPENGLIVIDVFRFFDDLTSAYQQYKQDLLEGQYTEEFEKRWNIAPLVQYHPDVDLKK